MVPLPHQEKQVAPGRQGASWTSPETGGALLLSCLMYTGIPAFSIYLKAREAKKYDTSVIFSEIQNTTSPYQAELNLPIRKIYH
jgi:hypothetical protein